MLWAGANGMDILITFKKPEILRANGDGFFQPTHFIELPENPISNISSAQ